MERLVFEHVDLFLEKYDVHHPPGNLAEFLSE
jgi:hypothetical protein